ncbi:MAG: penicillin-binding transpeptidase domain-containing protein [Chloroflexota bacterium]
MMRPIDYYLHYLKQPFTGLTALLLALGVLLALPAPAARAQEAPEAIVSRFLEAWNAQDYAAMYSLIYVHQINGQPEFAEQQFSQRYEAVAETLNLSGLSYAVREATIQGDSAAVTYDISLESDAFGTIEDPNRIMRLVRFDGVWRIAWSTMDIFYGLTRNSELRVQAESTRRATIYDRNGEVIATDGGTTVALYSARGRMPDELTCQRLLADLLRQPMPQIQQYFGNYLPGSVFFLGEIPSDVYERERSNLELTCGVGPNDVFTSAPQRTYYGGSAMVHVAGYVGQVTSQQEAQFGAGQIVGQASIEAAYNNVLAGSPERVVRIVEPGGTTLRELGSTAGSDPVPVQLTIDRDLQLITADAITQAFNYAVTNWGAADISPGGAAVVMDVNSGDILAMASYPMFNPNLFNPNSLTPNRGTFVTQVTGDSIRRPLLNKAIAERFAPGSVFKIITMAAVLNERITGLDETYFCDLYWEGLELGDTQERRPDWRVADEREPAGEVNPAQALMASCNPWFWQHGALLYQQVGAATLREYGQRMGLITSYDLDGLRVAEGDIPVAASADQAINESVGQGDVALPPLQMAVAVAAIANGGTVYEPRLVQQIGGLDGTSVVEQFETDILNTLDFNEGVLDRIREGMCGVTTNERLGTAYGRFVNNSRSEYSYTTVTAEYTSCGKTGTAETAGNPNAWYVTYAPAEDPQIAIVVMVEQSLEGSQVAAPIARRILDDYFNAERAPFPEWWNTTTFEPLDTPAGGGTS